MSLDLRTRSYYPGPLLPILRRGSLVSGPITLGLCFNPSGLLGDQTTSVCLIVAYDPGQISSMSCRPD
ncbi:hypothetical protein BJX68DRAFT_238083 [Aspergillus pseudodeflectus]|uniref:Uncharacterized protein n=1 Tax=Aspergillus pseudodeflectus TaxID=176178 RepID=A0ABR4K9N3_9EURO